MTSTQVNLSEESNERLEEAREEFEEEHNVTPSKVDMVEKAIDEGL